jgi:hypothetical protein
MTGRFSAYPEGKKQIRRAVDYQSSAKEPNDLMWLPVIVQGGCRRVEDSYFSIVDP